MKHHILIPFIVTLAILAGIHQAHAAVTFTDTPSVVSNTYAGTITLQIAGLTDGQTVVVQKFLDTDGSGVVDGSAFLVQQFQLTDGQASVFTNGATTITNIFLPSDTDGAVNGSITAVLYPSLDFEQMFVGKYLFVLSGAGFTPITNSFTVTNFPFAQGISGSVVSNGTATTLPYSVVVLIQGNGDNTSPLYGVVCNNSGAFNIKAPPGTYGLLGFQSNYVTSFASPPYITISNNISATTNVSMTYATNTITGNVADANTGQPLGGLTLSVQSPNQVLFALAYTDTNGNFTTHVTANQWKIKGDGYSVAWKGYNEGYDLYANTMTGNVSGLTLSLPKGTAIFYGKVTDTSGNPLAGADINSSDDNGNYEGDGYSYTNGQYITVAVGGLNNDPWQLEFDGDGPANYIYSQPSFDQNGGTNLNLGEAMKANFTGLLATNYITGNVSCNGTNLTGVGVSAYTTYNGVYFNSYADTDTNGNYSLPVGNSNVWTVSLNCSGGNDSVENVLGSDNFSCPNSLDIAITNDNVVTNFIVQVCNGLQILTTSLPNLQDNVYYQTNLQATSCAPPFDWFLDSGTPPPGLNLDSSGEVYGTPTEGGTYNFTLGVQDNDGDQQYQAYSVTVTGGPLQITTTSPLPNGAPGSFYSQTLQAVGGTPPYGWYIPNFSASPPANLSLTGNSGVLSGVPNQVGTYYFDVVVTDSVADVAEEDGLELIVESTQPPAALVITNVALPNGTNGLAYSAQLGATGGQPPYNWALALGSAGLPPGLALASSGLISGTPANNGQFYFQVQATDQYSTTTNQVLFITVNSNAVVLVVTPVLSQAQWLANRFTMRLAGASNQNYTILMSTNLPSTNWASLFVTNNPTANSFLVTDPNATNKQRFYRVLEEQ